MADRLRDIISRISTDTGLDLLPIYDGASSHTKKEIPKDPIEEKREQLPNRISKKAFDKALRNKKPKNQTKEAKRNRARDLRRIDKLRKQFKDRYGEQEIPKIIPSYLYIQTKDIVSDTTGGAAIAYLKACEHKIAVTLIKRAAFAADENGVNKYSFAGLGRGANRARCICALGLLLLGLSSKTGRRKDRWSRIVKGISIGQLGDAVKHPSPEVKKSHNNTISGAHRWNLKDSIDGAVGYLDALRNVGFCYAIQAHWLEGEKPDHRAWKDIQQCEIVPQRTKSGYRVSFNRYWIVTDRFSDAVNAATSAELWIAYLAGSLPDFPEHSAENESRVIAIESHPPQTKSQSPHPPPPS